MNFNKMTKTKLRNYLVNNPKDQTAFYAFIDRFTAEASTDLLTMPQSQTEIRENERLIQVKIEQAQKHN
jgi:predicted flavoprotein YhiN